MAGFTDTKGTVWTIRLSTPILIKLCRKLNLSLASITKLDVPIADVLESLPIICADQLRERKLSDVEFLDRIEGPALTSALAACRDAVVEAFPQVAKAAGAAGSGSPFGAGESTIS